MTLTNFDRDMDLLSDWFARQRDSAFTPDANGRKALSRAGWEVKGGILCAPTSSGRTVPMWPYEVLFGPLEGKDAWFRTVTRNTLQPSYRAAFSKFIYLSAKFHDSAVAHQQLEDLEQKALALGQDDTGGYVAPPDIAAELLARIAQRAVVRPRARVTPTGRDLLKTPTLQGHATLGSTFASGFVGDWMGETPLFTENDPKFGSLEIAVKKIRAGTKLSEDFVADAVVDILAWLAINGGDNMAVVEDQGFIAGDGSIFKPKGLLNIGAATVDVEGSTANTISNTTAAAGSAPKLKDLAYALPSQYARGASWIARRTVEGKARKLVDAQNRFHFPEDPSGTFIGKPIDNSDAMPDDGVNANQVLVFGDISQYTIAQRTMVSVVLYERFRDSSQIGFIIIERVGGDSHNPDAFRIGVV